MYLAKLYKRKVCESVWTQVVVIPWLKDTFSISHPNRAWAKKNNQLEPPSTPHPLYQDCNRVILTMLRHKKYLVGGCITPAPTPPSSYAYVGE